MAQVPRGIPEEPQPPYQPKDALALTTTYTMISAGVGAAVSGMQSTLTRQNLGAMGFLTRFGGTTATFAAMGGAFAFARTVSANLQQKDDYWSTAIGGFFSGAVLGLRARTMPSVLGYGVALAVIAGTYDYGGRKLSGWAVDDNLGDLDYKEKLKYNRRRDVWETVSELGEGRGVYGPGYLERRRQRILDHYGIDVGEAQKSPTTLN